ncbi:HD domain-containing protein [Carnobacterium gallinarum]|uniref:HD domain-containing protein n=1 Tax=Carnobacterium gallinarum TaxID=2749 RepID=UPI000555CB15|nr:HD domain-containing protein [Carnobacterium gallinarum]
MKYFDELYGEFDFAPIFAELIETTTFQRLKNVHMAGAAYLVNDLWDETRYEHSLGVALLIKRLGGSQEEQIAGLLHDISHTAFSHVIDTALDNKKENYHEQIKEQVLEDSQIPLVLEKWGYSYQRVALDDSNWGILEKEAPKLCADRIDYTLREIHRYYEVPLKEIELFIQSLIVEENEIIVQSVRQAEWFVENYYKIVIDFFYDPLNIYSSEIVSNILKLSLENQEIDAKDLLLTDDQLLVKLQKSETLQIKELLVHLTSHVELVVDEQDYDIHQKKKLRLVDPTVCINGKLVPVSTVSQKVKKLNKEALAFSKKGIYLKVK